MDNKATSDFKSDSAQTSDMLRGRASFGSKGYLMIQSAEINNFRGFRNVSLEGLSRINVVVGDNGAGKTALLEALFIGVASTADVPIRLKTWRGAEAGQVTGNPQEIYDGLFLELFHRFDRELIVTVSIHGNAGDSRDLRFFYNSQEPNLLPLSALTGASGPRPYTPITFEWKEPSGRIIESTPQLQATGLQIQPPALLPGKRDPAFLAARAQFPTAQNARWFSELSKRGKERRFIEAVRAQFTDIESLSVEVDMGNPVIFVKLPWLDQKMPIYLASDGLNKLATLVLHIAHSAGTALFVDEIENGFHFSRYTKLWEQLLTFAESYETQLFVTTHSWEYLKAGAPLMKQFPHDFSMIQVSNSDGVSSAVVVSGAHAAAAIENEIDVRGTGKN